MHNKDVATHFRDCRLLWVQLGFSSKEAHVERAVLAIAWSLLGDEEARMLQQCYGGQKVGNLVDQCQAMCQARRVEQKARNHVIVIDDV